MGEWMIFDLDGMIAIEDGEPVYKASEPRDAYMMFDGHVCVRAPSEGYSTLCGEEGILYGQLVYGILPKCPECRLLLVHGGA